MKQIRGSNSNFKTGISSRLNNNHNLSAKLNQDLLSTNLASHVSNSSLLYSSNNNSLNVLVYHQNIMGLKGKTNELISSLYPDLPHLLGLTEHRLDYSDLDHTYRDHYNLGAKYCRQILKKGGACIFVREKLKFTNINLNEFCK